MPGGNLEHKRILPGARFPSRGAGPAREGGGLPGAARVLEQRMESRLQTFRARPNLLRWRYFPAESEPIGLGDGKGWLWSQRVAQWALTTRVNGSRHRFGLRAQSRSSAVGRRPRIGSQERRFSGARKSDTRSDRVFPAWRQVARRGSHQPTRGCPNLARRGGYGCAEESLSDFLRPAVASRPRDWTGRIGVDGFGRSPDGRQELLAEHRLDRRPQRPRRRGPWKCTASCEARPRVVGEAHPSLPNGRGARDRTRSLPARRSRQRDKRCCEARERFWNAVTIPGPIPRIGIRPTGGKHCQA